jgi:diguanylate cyclase (GGDEF)-like protein/PAS domain S-box-containing protein
LVPVPALISLLPSDCLQLFGQRLPDEFLWSDVKRIDYLIVLKKNNKTADTSNTDSGRDTLEICGPDTPAAQVDDILQDDFARRLLASLPVSVFVLCLVSRDMIYSNRALSEELGYNQAPTAQVDEIETLIHPDDRESIYLVEQILERSEAGARTNFEFRLRHADGTWRWFAGVATVFERDSYGHPNSLVGVSADITNAKLAEEELRYDAGHDSLTGLLNRRRFVAELSARIAAGVSPIALCLCDIDHFKSVNDSYGHAAGDEALSAFAQVMRTNVRREDIVARLGGDEFCVLVPGLSASDAKTMIERIRHEFSRKEFAIENEHFSVTASFGIADIVPGMTVAQFLQSADDALYHAKACGRNEVSLFAAQIC